MIAIKRIKKIPAILTSKGAALSKHDHSLVTQNFTDYQNGKLKLSFKAQIYAHKTVKSSLLKMQHSKCCFCESKIDHICYGDVEHFRPKAGWRQTAGQKSLSRPGYYWLSYKWNNLFLCCQLCNQRHKRNLFPITAIRATHPRSSLIAEKPLLIDPSKEDPERYIKFRGDVPYAVKGNPRGILTIEGLRLDREPLKQRRKDLLNLLRQVFWVASGQVITSPCTKKEAKQLLAKHIKTNAEYSAVVKHAIATNFQYV